MGFFDKFSKRKKDESSSDVYENDEILEIDGDEDVKQRKRKQKNKKDSMRSVLNESVTETIIDIFKENDSFIIEEGGEEKYVGLYLDVDYIGGLSSKKDKKNEEKGSLVSSIDAGNIDVYISDEMLDNEEIIFIPNSETLTYMGEYTNLLVDAEYKWAIVDSTGDFYLDEENEANFYMAEAVNRGEQPIEFFLKMGDYFQVNPDEEYDETLDEDERVLDKKESLSDEKPITEEEQNNMVFEPTNISEDANVLSNEEIDEEVNTQINDDSNSSDSYVDDIDGYEIETSDDFNESYQTNDANYNNQYQEPAPEPEEVHETIVDQNEVDNQLYHIYSKDDLNIEANTAPFEELYSHLGQSLYFNYYDDSRWINSYLNTLVEEANNEISINQSKAYRDLKIDYINIANEYIKEIQKDVSLDGDNKYAQRFKEIKNTKDEKLNNLENEVSNKKQVLEDEWNEKLNVVGERGRILAIDNYKKKNERAYLSKVDSIETELLYNIQDKYESDFRVLNEERRSEAQKSYDSTIPHLISETQDNYNQYYKPKEDEIYEAYNQKIQDYINNTKQEDIDYMRTQRDIVDNNNLAEELAKDYNSRLDTMRKEFETRESNIKNVSNDEVDRIKKESEDKLKALEDKNKDTVGSKDKIIEEKDNTISELKGQMERLLDTVDKIDIQKEGKYKDIVDKYENQLKTWEDRYSDLEKTRSRDNISNLTKSILTFILALFMGMSVSTLLSNNNNNNSSNNQPPIIINPSDGNYQIPNNNTNNN